MVVCRYSLWLFLDCLRIDGRTEWTGLKKLNRYSRSRCTQGPSLMYLRLVDRCGETVIIRCSCIQPVVTTDTVQSWFSPFSISYRGRLSVLPKEYRLHEFQFYLRSLVSTDSSSVHDTFSQCPGRKDVSSVWSRRTLKTLSDDDL